MGGEVSRHPLAEDIVSALHEIEEADKGQAACHQVLFDPQVFLNANPDIAKEDFILDVDALRRLALQITVVRLRFKAEVHDDTQQPEAIVGQGNGASSKRVLKLSTPASNLEGLMERELKASQQAETVPA